MGQLACRYVAVIPKSLFATLPIVIEPSAACIPAGEAFTFRVVAPDADTLKPYKLQWTQNGRRIPGANGAELSFLQMRDKFDGAYKVLVIDGKGIYSSNCAQLNVLSAGSEAEIAPSRPAPAKADNFFDPTSSEANEVATTTSLAGARKKSFLEKALARCERRKNIELKKAA